MTIQDAATAMLDGKLVIRQAIIRDDPRRVPLRKAENCALVYSHTNGNAALDVVDLLADDWIVLKERKG